MCGIFGWSFQRKSKIPAGQREVLGATLAVANSMRGDHSWGVYLAGQKNTEPRVVREVGDIAEVAGIGARLAAYPVIMAHTRHATTGAISRKNQHPFKVGHVLLAHNGMVFNHLELNRRHGRDCAVDSQHFAHHLDAGLAVSEIEGYGALEWVEDSEPERTYLARLRSGQLSVWGIRNRKGKTVGAVWSSDEAHLRSAVGASRLDGYPFETLKQGEVYSVEKGMLYQTKRACLEISAPVLTDREWITSTSRTSCGGKSYRVRTWPRSSYSSGLDGSTWTPGSTWDYKAQRYVKAGDRAPTTPHEIACTRKPDTYEVITGGADRGTLLLDDGAGASATRDIDLSDIDPTIQMEAERRHLTQLDSGLYMDRQGKIVDLEAIADDEEEDAWKRAFGTFGGD
jgi:hypothetical protein